MKRVFTSTDPVLSGLVHSVLIAAGIPCLLRNQYLTGAMGELPLNECWPQVWVLDEADAAAAQRLIAAAVPTARGPSADWICAQCGETLEGQFRQCWQCGEWR